MKIQDVSDGMSFRLIVTEVSTTLLPSSSGSLGPSATLLPVDTMQQSGKIKFLKEQRLSLCCIVFNSYELEQKVVLGDNRTLFCFSVSIVTDCY